MRGATNWPSGAQAEASWAMLQLGLRVGARPRALITTTPRDGPLLGRILAEPGTVVSGGATGANPHLAPGVRRGGRGALRRDAAGAAGDRRGV